MSLDILYRQKWTGKYSGSNVSALRSDVIDTHDLFGFQTWSLLSKVPPLGGVGEEQLVSLTPFIGKNATVNFSTKLIRAIQFANYDSTAVILMFVPSHSVGTVLEPKSCKSFYFAEGLVVTSGDNLIVRFVQDRSSTPRPSSKKFKCGITIVADNP